MPYTTRDFDTAGPYGSTPGAPPPFHVRRLIEEGADGGDITVSRLGGEDETLNAAGWVGIQNWQGGEPAYNGRDPYDPGTWQTPQDVLDEQPGIFARLHQEGAPGG